MSDNWQSDASVAFERHRRRRAQGVPTVTVNIGDADIAEGCWSEWQRAHGALPSVATGAGPEHILHDWLATPVVRSMFASNFVQHGARTQRVRRA
jgi:hypothetical protein